MSTATRTRWPDWVLPSIFVTAVMINAFDYSVLVPQQDARIAAHASMIAGTAPAPQRYRVLVPWTMQPVIGALSSVMPADKAITRTYAALHLIALAGILGVCFAYARLWFPRDESLVIALLVGSVIRVTLRQGEYWDASPIPPSSLFAPSSLLDAVLVGVGLVWLHGRQHVRFLILVAAAALNSEASVLLPLIATGHAWRTGEGARVAALSAGMWMAITLALRMLLGFEMPSFTWHDNLAHLPATALNLALMLGPAVALVGVGWRQTPRFARDALVWSLPFLAGFAVWGYWWDVRVLMPMYPLVAPVVLSSLWDPQSENSLASSTHSPCGASRS